MLEKLTMSFSPERQLPLPWPITAPLCFRVAVPHHVCGHSDDSHLTSQILLWYFEVKASRDHYLFSCKGHLGNSQSVCCFWYSGTEHTSATVSATAAFHFQWMLWLLLSISHFFENESIFKPTVLLQLQNYFVFIFFLEHLPQNHDFLWTM